MSSARVLYHMVRADFLERVRRYSFLVTMAFALYLGYSAYSGHIVLRLGDYAGVLNSSWLGAMMALVTGTFLSLVGFYIVRNSVARDEQTRVGRILAATPMTKWFYVLAKALSNLAILMAMVLVLILCAIVMQLLKGEAAIHPWQVVAPFLMFVLPAMTVTAALAILFETTPGLRGGAGNVAYFFLWSFLLVSDIAKTIPSLLGLTTYMQSMGNAIRMIDPTWRESFSLTVGERSTSRTFLWTGMDWTPTIIAGRIFWLAIAVALCFAAAIPFNRFDPARQNRCKDESSEVQESTSGTADAVLPQQHLTPIAGSPAKSRFGTLVLTEIRMLLKGQRRWWYAVALGIALAGLLTPAVARPGLMVAAAIWPVLLWSQMGTRESLFNTAGLMFSCPEPLARQLPASWLAGVAVTALLTSTFAARMAVSGDFGGVVSWLAGIVFIPGLALALGTISGSKKAFEAIYTAWWYVGPAHKVAGLDFLGTVPASQTPLLYFGISTVLLVAAFVARRRALAYA